MSRNKTNTLQNDKFHAHISVAMTLLRQARDSLAHAAKERDAERNMLETLDLSIHDLELRLRDTEVAANLLLKARELWVVESASQPFTATAVRRKQFPEAM